MISKKKQDRPQPVMVRRVTATQATLDRFQGKPFVWGRADCARLAIFHVKQFGWKLRIGKAGAYSSALGARRALGRAGFTTLAEAIDAHGLPRIAPAAAKAGDLVELPSDDPVGAIGVALGNGRVLGWHPDAEGAVVVQPLQYVAAWSVLAGG